MTCDFSITLLKVSRNIEAAKTDMLAGEDTSKFSY